MNPKIPMMPILQTWASWVKLAIFGKRYQIVPIMIVLDIYIKFGIIAVWISESSSEMKCSNSGSRKRLCKR